MREDRERLGMSVARASWVLGVSVGRYRELESGDVYPDFETKDRICKSYGWPQTFPGTTVDRGRGGRRGLAPTQPRGQH
jgi:DNA-binding XRE family transcriptional regulator